MRAILETPRLILREMTEADAADLYRMNSNPNVVRYLGEEQPLRSPAEALETLRTKILPQYSLHKVGRWAVTLRESGAFIGYAGLKYIPEDNEFDLGYRFIEEFWRNGYGTECGKAVLEYGLRNLPGHRIVGKAYVENVASIRILQKIGMRFEKHEVDKGGTLAVFVATETLAH